MKKICVQCGKEFELSETEIDFYEQRKLMIPTSCYMCRRRDRIRRNAPVIPKGIGRNGKNRFGIGHAMPGMMSILLILAAFMFGRSFLSGGDGPKNPGNAVTEPGNTSKTHIFLSFDLLAQNYEKYGKELGCASEEEYLAAANEVISDPKSVHHQEDGEEWYKREQTGEQVILSADGYIQVYRRIDTD